METETRNEPPTLRASSFPGLFIVSHNGQAITMHRETLVAIVQAAYDVAGILASPSFEGEGASA